MKPKLLQTITEFHLHHPSWNSFLYYHNSSSIQILLLTLKFNGLIILSVLDEGGGWGDFCFILSPYQSSTECAIDYVRCARPLWTMNRNSSLDDVVWSKHLFPSLNTAGGSRDVGPSALAVSPTGRGNLKALHNMKYLPRGGHSAAPVKAATAFRHRVGCGCHVRSRLDILLRSHFGRY